MKSCNTESSLDLPLESLSLQPFLQSLHKEQWQEVRLGEVAEITSSKRIFYSEYVEYGIPFYRSKEIIEFSKGNNPQNELFIDENKYNDIANKCGVPQANDILLTSVGTLGIPYLVPKDKKFYFKDGNLTWFKNFKNITSLFLFYWFKSPQGKEKLDSIAIGSTQQALTIQGMKNLIFLLPPLTTQQKIAEILSSFDDKIDLLHRQNKTLESLALTLFRHYFIDNPKRDEWEEKPLKYFGNIICGKTPPKNQKEYFNGTYPFIKIPDMHNNVFVFQTADSLTQQGLDSQKAKTLPPFSVCVSCIATIGVVSMNANIAQTNQQINSIVPYKECYRYFLYCSMKSSFDELEAMASGGTATANLNTTDFSNMKLLLPREKEILRFHTETLPFFDKIYNNTKQIQNLQAMRDLMLRRMFN